MAEKLYGFDQYNNQKHKGYPKGLPEVVTAPFHFRLDELFDGLQSFCAELQPPYFSYLHLFPPHEPYRPSKDFLKHFAGDGWTPRVKPVHRFTNEPGSQEHLNAARINYDRFIANLDYEFGRLLDTFETLGILENSYVILTSDHGDMFERGERGHSTRLLYDAVIHSPLLISAPGKKSRTDIFSPTNSVDLLPTILGLANRKIPNWLAGNPLPELGGRADFDRKTFTMDAKANPAFNPLVKATIAMRKGNYKLIYYTGYEAKDSFELYDLETDPEEMNDLYPTGGSLAKSLADELLDSLETANKPYKR